jgi:hypothetical protein
MKRIILFVVLFLLTLPAFAGQGWYLMSPPTRSQFDLRVIASAPLNEWSQDKAFDTAAECEQFLSKLRKDSEARLQRMRNEENIYLKSVRHYSLCIASDDPRLK